MKFLPIEKITIKSNLRPEAVYRVIETSMRSSNKSEPKVFRGKLQEDYFKITPWYFFFYNAYLPVLIGRIKSDTDGSIVTVTIRPDLIQVYSLLFFAILGFYGFLLNMSTVVTTGQISDETKFYAMFFLGTLLFLYLISMIAYKPNISKYKNYY